MKAAPPARIPANTVSACACSFRFCTGGENSAGIRFFFLFIMRFRISRAFTLVLGVCAACATLAQSPGAALEPVVVSGSRTEQRLQDTLPAITLITRADIEASLALDLPGVLRRVAGVELSQSGGLGTVASAFIRGAEARHTLVLIDGVAVNNHNFGTAALEHLALENIERIEVVRGNVSALYGSAALGGVVQIFTRSGAPGVQPSAMVVLGSAGLRKVDASLDASVGSSTRLALSVQDLHSDGFNALDQAARPATNPDKDGYSRRAVSLGLAHDLGRMAGGGSPSSLNLRLRDARGSAQYDSQFGPATQADESRYAQSGAALQLQLKAGSGLSLNAQWVQSVDDLNAAITAYPYYVKSRSTGPQAALDWQVGAGQVVSAALEHSRQTVVSDTAYTKGSRTQDSARLAYVGDYGQHQVQASLRQDRYTEFGSANTYFLGYAWRFAGSWRVNASSSTGFNAPTFNDLYFPWGGNAALKPERLRSGELGLQYAGMGQEFRAILFRNRYRDLIGNDAYYNRVNVAAARNEGLELSYRGQWGATGLRASATVQDPVDESSGQRLAQRADALAKLGLTHSVGAWALDADLRYSGARPDAGKTLAAYTVADVGLRYGASRTLGLTLRVENLSDAQYHSVYGYRQSGRVVALGLSWRPAQ